MKDYLSDPVFRAPNFGPMHRGRRLPSVMQIEARCEAIQRTWSRREKLFRQQCVSHGGRGESEQPALWAVPQVSTAAIGENGGFDAD